MSPDLREINRVQIQRDELAEKLADAVLHLRAVVALFNGNEFMKPEDQGALTKAKQFLLDLGLDRSE